MHNDIKHTKYPRKWHRWSYQETYYVFVSLIEARSLRFCHRVKKKKI